MSAKMINRRTFCMGVMFCAEVALTELKLLQAFAVVLAKYPDAQVRGTGRAF
jgi:hypothetical protein